MIIGTGSDLLDIRRIEKTLDKFGQRFITRCFTATEIQKAERRRAAGTHIATYAKRFAAKEACSKALGTGFSHGVFMKDIGVVNDANGAPTLHLTNGAKARADFLAQDKPYHIHVTLTDEPPYVHASVIIETR